MHGQQNVKIRNIDLYVKVFLTLPTGCLRQTISEWTTVTLIIWRYVDTGPSANFDISRLICYPNIYYHVQKVLSCTMTSGT